MRSENLCFSATVENRHLVVIDIADASIQSDVHIYPKRVKQSQEKLGVETRI